MKEQLEQIMEELALRGVGDFKHREDYRQAVQYLQSAMDILKRIDDNPKGRETINL